MRAILPLLGLLALLAAPAAAASWTILGGTFDLRTSLDDAPSRRRVAVFAKEGPASLDLLVGDPTVAGATLRVVALGPDTTVDETFDLPAAGWKATFKLHDWPVFKGFRYDDTLPGGAVKTVIVKRSGYASPEGTPPPEEPRPGIFQIKVKILGSQGPVAVRPPNPGSEGGIVLTLGGGDAYCVGFGGAAGGTVIGNTPTRFAIRRPPAEGCPVALP
jgi:hypothetical protein